MKTVCNPRWLQIIFYVAILVSPLLAAYVFYLGVSTFATSVFFGLCILVVAFGLAYLSYLGIRFAKFVPAKATFDDEQFHVMIGDITSSHQWSDITFVKNYKLLQTLELLNSASETIYAVDYLTPGYKTFAEKVKESVGSQESQSD